MNYKEMREYAYTCMVENNKDETIKTLIKYDIENNKLIHKNNNLRDEILDLNEIIDKAIEILQDYDLVENKDKVISDTFKVLRGEDIKEIPQFEGTLEQLDKLSIRGN